MGRVFRKVFRILGLGERKGRWVMEQDLQGDLQVNLAVFLNSFSICDIHVDQLNLALKFRLRGDILV